MPLKKTDLLAAWRDKAMRCLSKETNEIIREFYEPRDTDSVPDEHVRKLAVLNRPVTTKMVFGFFDQSMGQSRLQDLGRIILS